MYNLLHEMLTYSLRIVSHLQNKPIPVFQYIYNTVMAYPILKCKQNYSLERLLLSKVPESQVLQIAVTPTFRKFSRNNATSYKEQEACGIKVTSQ